MREAVPRRCEERAREVDDAEVNLMGSCYNRECDVCGYTVSTSDPGRSAVMQMASASCTAIPCRCRKRPHARESTVFLESCTVPSATGRSTSFSSSSKSPTTDLSSSGRASANRRTNTREKTPSSARSAETRGSCSATPKMRM